MIPIDKNIPLPAVRVSPDAVYPFRIMEVGDSFFLAKRKSLDVDGWNDRLAPKVFVSDVVTEAGVSGVRVWRVQ